VVDCLLILNVILTGFEGQYIIKGLISISAICWSAKSCYCKLLMGTPSGRRISHAKQCSNTFLYQAIEMANECDLNDAISKKKRLIELTLIKLCQLSENPVDSKGETRKIKRT
jgi:DNA polymerase-3 subunit gamma/tau